MVDCAEDVRAIAEALPLDRIAVGSRWFDEAFARAHDWGFDLTDISVQVLVMHGRKDVSTGRKRGPSGGPTCCVNDDRAARRHEGYRPAKQQGGEDGMSH
ncbi:MAG TPA: hypothetical protein VMK16_07640, partial [Acidimicrobiales bacterium]|nr:hypothetical protein [Acidimicrobiales bacterium]